MPTEEKIETTGAHMISCRRRCIEYTDQTRVSVLDGQSIPSLKHINRCWPFGGPYPSLDLNTGPAYIADKSYILADLQALDLDPSRENAVPAEGHLYYRSPNPEPAGNNSNFPLSPQNPAQTPKYQQIAVTEAVQSIQIRRAVTGCLVRAGASYTQPAPDGA